MKLNRMLKRLPGLRPNPALAANENASSYAIRLDLRNQPLPVARRVLVWAAQLAVLITVASLSFWIGTHYAPVAKAPAMVVRAPTRAAHRPTLSKEERAVARKATIQARRAQEAAAGPGPRYVHRAGSDLRDKPKTSGHILKKEAKGAKVILVSQTPDGWARVTDGNIGGWMRSSVLGLDVPN